MSLDCLKDRAKLKEMIVQFFKFGIVGLFNTFLSYVIYLFWWKLGVHYLWSQAIAFFISVFFSYVLNRYFVFKKKKGSPGEFLQGLIKSYLSYASTSLVLSTILLALWVEIIGIPEVIAPLFNLVLTVPLNFLLNKFWVHRKK